MSIRLFLSSFTRHATLVALVPGSLFVLAAGCAGEGGGDAVAEAALGVTISPWTEPLPSALSYPGVGSIDAPWDDGLTASQMTSIGHSCGYLQAGSTCGDGLCQAEEGTDPTTCWEDCVRQPWVEGQQTITLDKIVFYGVSTGRLWSTDSQTGEPTFLIADAGYLPLSGGTPDAGYGSQLLLVRKLDAPQNGDGYCVEKRFRGRTLGANDGNLLAWTHNAERTHDGHILVTHTNGSTIYKLDGDDFHVRWKMDGLHFDSSASGAACAAGPSTACCSSSGCDIAFTEDGGVGGVSYENMVREVYDSTLGKYRYVISNRDWHTIVMVDAQSTSDSPPVVQAGTSHGKVSWAFGLHKQPAITSSDLCQVSLPHGVKFSPSDGKLLEADLAIGRAIEIPYAHDCYASSPSQKATLVDGTAPQSRAVEWSTSGKVLFTQNAAEGNLLTRKYPVEENGGTWRLRANMVYHGSLAGTFAFDLHGITVDGDRYLAYSGPTCKSNTLGSTNWAREAVLTLWHEGGSETTPFFMYPAAEHFVDTGLVCDGSY